MGGAISLKFAKEGFLTVLTTRSAANAAPLEEAVREQGGESLIVELDLASRESISAAFARIREDAGEPDVLVYNAGYLEGRDLPPEKELLEHIPFEMFETAQHIASSGPFLVAKEVLPGMRERGEGSILFSNNSFGLRGKKRYTGQSLYYPRVLMRTLAQALTEEYSEHGVHVRQRGDRRDYRFSGHPGPAPGPAAARIIDQSRQDRRGFLLPAHPGQVLLDSRAPIDPLCHQAELLTIFAEGRPLDGHGPAGNLNEPEGVLRWMSE